MKGIGGAVYLTGGLNTDTDPAYLPAGDALEIRNMRSAMDSTLKGKSDVVTMPTYAGTGPHPDMACIASIQDNDGDGIVFFHSPTSGDSVVRLSYEDGNAVFSVLWNGDAGWDMDTRIHADIAGDYLLWSVEGGTPRMMDMKRAEQGWYDGKGIESMDLAKVQPSRILHTYRRATSEPANTNDRVFQFSYRYVFDTGQTSLLAPFTQAVITRGSSWLVMVGLTSSHVMPPDVSSVEYCVRESTEEVMQVFYTDRRTDLKRSDWWKDEIEFTNLEMRYPLTQDETTLMVSVMPTSVSALCVAANRLFLGGYTVGYGITQVPITATAQYTDLPSVDSNGTLYEIAATDNLLPMGFDYRVSVAFFDKNGRSPGVSPSFDPAPTKEMVWEPRGFPMVSYEQGCNEIEWSINVIEDAQAQYIPRWAHSYQVMVSVHPGIIGILGGTVSYMSRTPELKSEYAYPLESGSGKFMAIRILEVLNKGGQLYEFSKGDRVKIWFNGEGARVFDMEVLAYHSGSLYVHAFTTSPWVNFPNATNLIDFTIAQFLLYRPSLSQDPFYSENGQSFLVTEPGTDNRKFSVRSSTMSDYIRGSYTRKVDIAAGKFFVISNNRVVEYTGGIAIRPLITFMPSPFDQGETPEYGRQMVIPQDPKEEEYPHGIAVSDALVIGSKLNGLGTFLPGSRYLLESTSASIKVLRRQGQNVLAFTPIGVSILAVGQQFLRAADDGGVMVQSGKVIGQDVDVTGAQGCSDIRRVTEADGLVVYVSDAERLTAVTGRESADIGAKANVSNAMKRDRIVWLAFEPRKKDLLLMYDGGTMFMDISVFKVVQVTNEHGDGFAKIGERLMLLDGPNVANMSDRGTTKYSDAYMVLAFNQSPQVPKLFTMLSAIGGNVKEVRVSCPDNDRTTIVKSQDFRQMEVRRTAHIMRDDKDGNRYEGDLMVGGYATFKVYCMEGIYMLNIEYHTQKGYGNSNGNYGGGGPSQDAVRGD